MIDKDLARSFIFMWDMMVLARKDLSIPVSTYQHYHDGAYALYLQLFNQDMDYCYEIERGIVNNV